MLLLAAMMSSVAFVAIEPLSWHGGKTFQEGLGRAARTSRSIIAAEKTDVVTKTATIAASQDKIFNAIIEFEKYPSWAKGLKSAVVLERDDNEYPRVVEFKAGTMGLSISYTLQYEIDPDRVSWKSIAGGVKSIVGSYDLKATSDSSTEVTYALEVDAGFNVPGPVRRGVTNLIVSSALPELKRFVER